MWNSDLFFGFANIAFIIVGWFAVFIAGSAQQKKSLQNSAKMKVYEELYGIKLQLDESFINLGLLFHDNSLPFPEMKISNYLNL